MAVARTPAQPLAPQGIPGHLVGFVEALRKVGINVGPSETVDAGRRHTLRAVAEDGGYRFDVRLQGDDETVFLAFPRH